MSFWCLISAVVLLGTCFRLRLFADQILLNDEWHGLHYVIDRSFAYVCTHFSAGANSIPMNVYAWVALRTCGWSEVLLRLPSMLAGLVSLLLLPSLVKTICNHRTTVIFTSLLAMSPLLIFYSRVYRPYSIVALLGFVSMFYLYCWLRTGRVQYAVVYVVTGILAMYFHPYAVMTVVTPLVCGFLLKWKARCTRAPSPQAQIVPAFSTMIVIGASLAVLEGLLLCSAYVNNVWWLSITGSDRITLRTVMHVLSLLSGSANPWLTILFVGCLCVGLTQGLRTADVFQCMVFSIVMAYVGVMSINSQEGIHATLPVARYCISAVPLGLLVTAVGMDRVLQSCESAAGAAHSHRRVRVANGCAAVFLSALVLTGPLRRLYAAPNNFTNHSAFQESYQPRPPERSFPSDFTSLQMDRRNIPPFYAALATQAQVNRIIEYPMYVGDHLNLYYYYQSLHQKRVIAGYDPTLTLVETRNRDFVYDDTPLCEILSALRDRTPLQFRNLVDMTNIDAITDSQADYIILHKNLMNEMFPDTVKTSPWYQPVRVLTADYQRSFGSPIYEDRHLIVFDCSMMLIRR